MFTNEELELFSNVKNSGFCHEDLVWKRVDVGEVSYVNGIKVNSTRKTLQSTCSICNTEYIKDFIEEQQVQEKKTVDLDRDKSLSDYILNGVKLG